MRGGRVQRDDNGNGRSKASAGLRALAVLLILGGILAGSVRAAGAQTRSDEPESGVDGATYTGVNFDWSVEWDGAEWELDSEDNSTGSDSIILVQTNSDAGTAGFIAADDRDDVDQCLDSWIRSLVHTDSISNVDESFELATPRTDRDAVGAAYTYDQSFEDGSIFVGGYAECRPLAGGGYLLFFFSTTLRTYEDSVPLIEDLLASVDTGSGRDADAGTDPGDERDVTLGDGNDEAEPANGGGSDDGSYRGAVFNWSVDWDTDVWTLYEEDSDATSDYLSLDTNPEGADDIDAGVSFYADNSSPDVDSCVDSYEAFTAELDYISDFASVDDLETPRAPSDAADGIYAYTQTYEDVQIDFVAYVQCRPIAEDGGILTILVIASPDEFQDLLPHVEDLIDAVDVG